MKPNELKDALQQNTLQPDRNSWNTLAQQLDHYNAKKRRARRAYLSYAALLALLLTTAYFVIYLPFAQQGQLTGTEDKPAVQEEPAPGAEDPSEYTAATEKTSDPETAPALTQTREPEALAAVTKTSLQTESLPKEDLPLPIREEITLEAAVVAEKSQVVSPPDTVQQSSTDIDALLADAQLRLALQQQPVSSEISAGELLNQIEYELEYESLPDKIYEKIRKTLNNPENRISLNIR